MNDARADRTRELWLATLEKFRFDASGPASAGMWSPRLDAASRDELISIQNEKLSVMVPFLYENSPFYRRRFERLGLVPSDIRGAGDLHKWPIVDKAEMMADAAEHPPYGTYTTVDESVWAKRGWMMFSSSGSTGAPRVFRYTHADREAWAWANARALYAMGFRPGRDGFHDDRIWPPRLGLGRAVRAGKNGAAEHSRRRHGRQGACQCHFAL